MSKRVQELSLKHTFYVILLTKKLKISCPHDIELPKFFLLVIFYISYTSSNMFILWISSIDKFLFLCQVIQYEVCKLHMWVIQTHYSKKSNKTCLKTLFNSLNSRSCDCLFFISTSFCLSRFKEIHFILSINSNRYVFTIREYCCYYEATFANVFVGILYILVIEKCS